MYTYGPVLGVTSIKIRRISNVCKRKKRVIPVKILMGNKQDGKNSNRESWQQIKKQSFSGHNLTHKPEDRRDMKI